MKKLLLATALLSSSLLADKALDEQLLGTCDLNTIKELIAKGADINAVDKKGVTVFTNAARNNAECGEAAKYLSSIGAKDSGLAAYWPNYVKGKTYDTPKVYENKHLKLTIPNIYISGGSTDCIFENKTDDYIYIYSDTIIINGIKYSISFKNQDGTSEFPIKPYGEKEMGILFKHKELDKYPKVVNNKVNFTREYIMKYAYKGKEYELKTPKTKEEIDLEFEQIPDIGWW